MSKSGPRSMVKHGAEGWNAHGRKIWREKEAFSRPSAKDHSGVTFGCKAEITLPPTTPFASLSDVTTPFAKAANGITYNGKAEIGPPPTIPLASTTKVSTSALKAAGTDLTAAYSYPAGIAAHTTATTGDGDVKMSDVGPVGGAVAGEPKAPDQTFSFALPFRPVNGGVTAAIKIGPDGQRCPSAPAYPRLYGNRCGIDKPFDVYDPAHPDFDDRDHYCENISALGMEPPFAMLKLGANKRNGKVHRVCKDCGVTPPTIIEDETTDDDICGDCGLVLARVDVSRD